MGLGRNLAVGSCGKVPEDNLDVVVVAVVGVVVVVDPAHSGEEDKRIVADHPDQPGLEVDRAHHTTWAGVDHSALDRPVHP